MGPSLFSLAHGYTRRRLCPTCPAFSVRYRTSSGMPPYGFFGRVAGRINCGAHLARHWRRGFATPWTPRSRSKLMTKTLPTELLHKMDAYWHAANYLTVGQIYLHENPLLEVPLTREHIKPRLLGHWG